MLVLMRVMSRGTVHESCVPGEVQRPAGVAVNSVAHRLPAGAVPIETAVLELEPCPIGALGHKPDLDLTGVVGVALDLPGRADEPAEHHSVGRLEGEHPSPAALAPVLADVVDVSAHVR